MQQDLIIRGSALDNNISKDSLTLTVEGYKFLNETLGIKLEIDLRGENENCSRTNSALSNASYLHVPLTAYSGAFYADQKGYYLEVFKALAKKDNYPVYIHCTGGADRTGTVAALILALLNVSYDEIIQDYTLTSFSRVGVRSKSTIDTVINGLRMYKGKTLQEKCETYLLSIGLTKEEISTIKAIMYGEANN